MAYQHDCCCCDPKDWHIVKLSQDFTDGIPRYCVCPKDDHNGDNNYITCPHHEPLSSSWQRQAQELSI